MKLLNTIAGLSGVVTALQSVLDHSAKVAGIPTTYESAVMGRRILALTKLGTLSTIFPQASGQDVNGQEALPAGIAGQPIGLMDYVADCEDEGNPTILAFKIGTTFRNVRAGSNITLSMRWTPPYAPAKRMDYRPDKKKLYNSPLEQQDNPDTVPYSAANLPRFSLFGYLETIHTDDDSSTRLAACYTAKHDDAKRWLPGKRVHESEWTRLVVTHVYWIGGFGDRAYIGWIPVELWKKVTRADWEAIKLPGEKEGWSE
ncbi:hypothetical protein EsDP_00000893 [Epichloe bromicola]|uniref:CREG-like beta-barrel domain-containing protein n=1 Tax=Epichloe bromicola TaxID=79588 RepID=A0ABQ0CG96_9HYPO